MRIVRGVKGWFESTFRVGGFWFNALFVVLALGLGGGAGWFAFEHWGWLQGDAGNPESNSTTLRNVALIIGGVVALVLALWRGIVAGHQADAAQQQVELGQQDLLNERYQKGAEMLGNEVLAVRMGGIYALKRLAEEHPEQYYLQIMDLLCAFVRHPTEDKMIETSQGRRPPKLREDVAVVIEIIRKRNENLVAVEKANDFRLDINHADLRGADLRAADLSSANLQGADLSNAYLPQVDLSDANLQGATLFKSDLSHNANLSSARLHFANLSHAQLVESNLSEAYLHRAKLDYARLTRANLRGANLLGADLTDADLAGADLSESFMHSAMLASADLKNTKFSHAYIAAVEFYDDHECDDTDECSNMHRCHNYDEWNDAGFCNDEDECRSAHRKAENKKPAMSLTQGQLDETDVEPGDILPRLDGFVMDAKTGEPLVWKGEIGDGAVDSRFRGNDG